VVKLPSFHSRQQSRLVADESRMLHQVPAFRGKHLLSIPRGKQEAGRMPVDLVEAAFCFDSGGGRARATVEASSVPSVPCWV